MKILNPRTHGWLDLLTVGVFLIAPTIFEFSGAPAVLSYVLAAVHLAMTVVTDGIPIAVSSRIPLPLHGLVEAGVGIVLGLLGLFAFDGAAQTFYLVLAAVILLVFAITSYTETA